MHKALPAHKIKFVYNVAWKLYNICNILEMVPEDEIVQSIFELDTVKLSYDSQTYIVTWLTLNLFAFRKEMRDLCTKSNYMQYA